MASEAARAPVLDEPATAKDEKKAKGKKGKNEGKAKETEPQAGGGAPTIVAHPRAMRSIARAKGWAGLFAFFLAGYLALPTSTLAGAMLRALIAGVVTYVVVWGAAVFVWRRLVMLELNGRQAQMLAELQETAKARPGPGAPPGLPKSP
jgi:hypothetical protein